ncbi:MAG: DciA family protein [Candidatus Tyrphobacter sp.]
MLTPLSRALERWSPTQTGGDPVITAAAAWPEIVGTDVAANSQPVEIASKTLVVVTRSSAWSEQLSFLSERILTSLREGLGLHDLARIRFRVGRVSQHTRLRVVRGTTPAARRRRSSRAASTNAQDAMARFRSAVARAQRAKSQAGWKECSECASLVPPGVHATCTPCTIAAAHERERLVARLLFEAPWLGFAGIAALVDGLGRTEFEGTRSRLLARWWSFLVRGTRSKTPVPTRRERLIASSYVIAKSGLDPESIAPATMRNVLGDEIFDRIYGTRE